MGWRVKHRHPEPVVPWVETVVLGYDLEFRAEQEALLGVWADVTMIK